MGITQLNNQRFVARRFVDAIYNAQRPVNRATTGNIVRIQMDADKRG